MNKPAPAPKEMRAHRRAPLTVEVTLESENNFYTGITGDVSEGGVFIATYTAPPVGATVELVLSLPHSTEVFDVRGVVRWVRPLDACGHGLVPGCGIQWTEISHEALSAIHAFVQGRDTIFFEVL